ncbi:MAG: hypothetical protein J6V62_06570 [Paludibacteraceae bacterium]|nr:hypothetical protein [Paludibacteraceae bacterium]
MFEKEKICKNCGSIGHEQKMACTTTSHWIAIGLLGLCLFVILPFILALPLFAFFYGLDRLLLPRKIVCPSFKAEGAMIPMDTPIGKKLLQEFKDKQDN